MEGYCKATGCLRNYILEYFGEKTSVPVIIVEIVTENTMRRYDQRGEVGSELCG